MMARNVLNTSGYKAVRTSSSPVSFVQSLHFDSRNAVRDLGEGEKGSVTRGSGRRPANFKHPGQNERCVMTQHLKIRFQVIRLAQTRLMKDVAPWEWVLLEGVLDEVVLEKHRWTVGELKECLAALVESLDSDRPICLMCPCLRNAFARAQRRQMGRIPDKQSLASEQENDGDDDFCGQVVRVMGPDDPNLGLLFDYLEAGSYARLSQRLKKSRGQVYHRVALARRAIRNRLRREFE